MPDLESHLVLPRNEDADLARFYGEDLVNPDDAPEPDDRPLCEREQMCNGCDRCQKEEEKCHPTQ